MLKQAVTNSLLALAALTILFSPAAARPVSPRNSPSAAYSVSAPSNRAVFTAPGSNLDCNSGSGSTTGSGCGGG